MVTSPRIVVLCAFLSFALCTMFSRAFAEDTLSNVAMYEMRIARLERMLKESEGISKLVGVTASSKSSDDDKEKEDDDDKEKEKDDDKEKEKESDDDKEKEKEDDDDKEKEKESDDDKEKEKEKEDDDDKEKEKEDDKEKEKEKEKENDDDDDKEKEDDDDDKEKDDEDEDDDKEKPKVKGDPHFTGADSSHFDFSGVPNNSYCLLSDSHLHLNAYFGGYYGAYEGNPSKALTWMRKIGLLWGHHSFLFEAREGASWQYGSGYMSRMEVDGEEVLLSQPGDKAQFADGAVTIAWEAARKSSGDDEIDVYSVEIVGVVKIAMELRPEVPSLRTDTDGTVHFDLQFLKSHLSANAHGVLGQTYRPDHRDRLAKQKLVFSNLLGTKVVPGDNAEGFLDGTVEEYRSSAILLADCQVSRFSRAQQLDEETSLAIEMSTRQTQAVGSSGLPRKMLTLRAF